jgi:hypothetical protein
MIGKWSYIIEALLTTVLLFYLKIITIQLTWITFLHTTHQRKKGIFTIDLSAFWIIMSLFLGKIITIQLTRFYQCMISRFTIDLPQFRDILLENNRTGQC